MDTFKQVLAFPLYLTVVVAVGPRSPDQHRLPRLHRHRAGHAGIAFWLWERQRLSGRNFTRIAAGPLIAALLIPLEATERAGVADSTPPVRRLAAARG